MAKYRFKRFRDFQEDNLLIDLHVHSRWSDGVSTVAELAAGAIQEGLRCMAITDHVSANSKFCGELALEIALSVRELGIPILSGFEASVSNFDGDLELPGEACETADLIIGSVHGIPIGSGLLEVGGMPFSELAHLETKLCLAIISSGNADILGHAGGLCLNRYKRMDKESLESIVEACAFSGTAFEISAKYHASLIPELLTILDRHNPTVSIGSDAHNPQEIGSCTALLRKNWALWRGFACAASS